MVDAPGYQDLVRDEQLIVSVVSEDFPLKAAGNRWVTTRGAASDTLNVFRGNDGVMRYKRFGTGQGGTIFEYLRDYRGVQDRFEALRVLGYGPGERGAARRRFVKPITNADPIEQPWRAKARDYLDLYISNKRKYEAWQLYRPFRNSTIDSWLLGVGVMPAYLNDQASWRYPGNCKHERLIVPIIQNDRILAFRGRSIPGVCSECPKWVGTKSSEAMLFGSDRMLPGREVIVTEAPVGVIFGMQERHDINVVAGTAGASTWLPAWTDLIVAVKPPRVWVWFDNDLAGYPNSETYAMEIRKWEEKWRAKQPDRPLPKRPEPSGPRIAAALAEAGLYATLFPWPINTPVNEDFDSWLMGQLNG